MKSKSPFAIKSPLRVQVYGGDTYESPDTVITKTVGEQVGKAITGLADNASKYMDLKGKLAYDKKNPKTKSNNRTSSGDTNITNYFGSETNPNDNSNESSSSSTSRKIIKEVLPYEGGYQGKKMSEDKWNSLSVEQKRKMNANVGANEEGIIGHDGYRILEINKKNNNVASSSGANFNGSPNKLIGDTMDLYGQINPGAVPPNQAQNDLGAQPIIEAQGSQPSARAIDMAAIENPYATPGADFNPQSKMKAESIFGSPMQRQGLMNLGTPLHDKGHANDYEGHTHRKKGGSYKEGDYMDETDMETSYPKLYTQDVGEIKRDKKSQFMVSKNEDYSPTKIDTIRPLKGKEFKMGWGDAERNISTNPKYKKSK